ncbi:MAG: hypothetical protein JW839_12220, partial [Candidatus Lokiarchaeota archaeon]|nr:hypothetical protein [Candidatus Lokiarchaeota archaeon]
MDTEKSKKLYSLVWLFALIDIPLAAVVITFAYIIRLPILMYDVIPIRHVTVGPAIAAAAAAVLALIGSMQGKAKVAEDEKTVFIIALLTLM